MVTVYMSPRKSQISEVLEVFKLFLAEITKIASARAFFVWDAFGDGFACTKSIINFDFPV
jgi:hypothetical protein